MTAARSSSSADPSESLAETAALWHERLHRDPAHEETRAAFARWRDAAPEHGAAYEAVCIAWSLARSAAQRPSILALRHETSLRLARRFHPAMRWSIRAAAAVLLAAVGGALLLAAGSGFEHRQLAKVADAHQRITALVAKLASGGGERYATAIGERLTVTLEDGSRVTLNTQTEIRSAFTAAERKLVLVRGQALFEVAKEAGRPFVVEAQGQRLVALGTAFDVRIGDAQVQVTMVEGTIRVERAASSSALDTPAGAPLAVTTLTAGEQLTVDTQDVQRVRVADAARVTSWRRGQAIFENARLADAIAELNRYSETKIELADPGLADLRLSGAFATGRPAVFVEALAAYFPVEVTQADARIVVLGTRERPRDENRGQ